MQLDKKLILLKLPIFYLFFIESKLAYFSETGLAEDCIFCYNIQFNIRCCHLNIFINKLMVVFVHGAYSDWKVCQNCCNPLSRTCQYSTAQVLFKEWDKSTNITFTITARSPSFCPNSSRRIKLYCLYVATFLLITAH